ncbi:hypothetical protein ILUMI_14446 [Ignelater luminosus]|uniref:PiggyBac transposable element-derived protein domain-containing protein n=1 Tax=Ignelater luminosus TaxID=2038154 RepID=A0A8K0CWJ8_IGNLU|nr:hypothetical protein ILUMI_14446 [Ignelater luminosus]
MLIIQIERDGIDAEKDFAEIQEDKEDEAELSNSDNDADRDEEVWVSKDRTIRWGTKEPTRKNILSRSIVKLASGIPRHLNLFTPVDYFRAFMTITTSRHRYSNILSCLRFDARRIRQARKETTQNKTEPIADTVNMFVAQCKNCFIPSPSITVNELLCTFRGRHRFKVYILFKPGKIYYKNMDGRRL